MVHWGYATNDINSPTLVGTTMSSNTNLKKKKPATKGRSSRIPVARGEFKGNGYTRFKKLIALGVKHGEAKRMAHNVRESAQFFAKVKNAHLDEIRGVVNIEENNDSQVDVNTIFQFERQRDILRRLLAQGVTLKEAIPLAKDAGECQEPFSRVLAKRFVREQLANVRSSSDEIEVKGGSRKRFRKLISRGVHLDKARTLCQSPWETKKTLLALRGIHVEPKATTRKPPTSNTNKSLPNRQITRSETGTNLNTSSVYSGRSRGEIATHTQQRINPNEIQEQDARCDQSQINSPTIRYNDVEREQPFLESIPIHRIEEDSVGIKLAVISPDFPVSIWPTEMLKGIQYFITKAAQNDGIDLASRYATCTFRPGWIAYSIHDRRVAQWFRERVPNLRPYEAFLAVVDQDQVPRPQVFVGYIPEGRNIHIEDLLAVIGLQNQGLRTQEWNVIDRVQRGSIVELIVVVDPFSARTIQQNNYSIRYGNLSACIKPRQSLDKPFFPELVQSSTNTTSMVSSRNGQANNQKSSYGSETYRRHIPNRNDQHRDNRRNSKNSYWRSM